MPYIVEYLTDYLLQPGEAQMFWSLEEAVEYARREMAGNWPVAVWTDSGGEKPPAAIVFQGTVFVPDATAQPAPREESAMPKARVLLG